MPTASKLICYVTVTSFPVQSVSIFTAVPLLGSCVICIKRSLYGFMALNNGSFVKGIYVHNAVIINNFIVPAQFTNPREGEGLYYRIPTQSRLSQTDGLQTLKVKFILS